MRQTILVREKIGIGIRTMVKTATDGDQHQNMVNMTIKTGREEDNGECARTSG